MKAYVKCSSCEKKNDADRLFCKFCGAKLDLSQARFDGGPSAVAGRLVQRVIRTVILLGLLAVLGLLMWPVEPTGAVGDFPKAERCYDKLTFLYEAIEIGRPLEQVLEEDEINAYLAHLMEEGDEPSAAKGFVIRSATFSLQEAVVVVHVLAEWNVLKLTYLLEVVPTATDDGLQVEVVAVQLGHLPVPGVIQSKFAQRVWPLFEQMERERYVLDRIHELTISEGRVRLRVALPKADI